MSTSGSSPSNSSHANAPATVSFVRLAAPIQTQLEESDLQAALEALPGVSAVAFPRRDLIEITYHSSLGERLFDEVVRRAGFVPAEIGVKSWRRNLPPRTPKLPPQGLRQ